MLSFSDVANVAEGFWQCAFPLARLVLREKLAAQAVHIMNARLEFSVLVLGQMCAFCAGVSSLPLTLELASIL